MQLIMLMSSVESPAWLEYHGAISQAQAARNRLLREADRFPNELPLQLDSGAVPVEPLLPTIQEVRPLPCCERPGICGYRYCAPQSKTAEPAITARAQCLLPRCPVPLGRRTISILTRTVAVY